jgi:hypothetical protein
VNHFFLIGGRCKIVYERWSKAIKLVEFVFIYKIFEQQNNLAKREEKIKRLEIKSSRDFLKFSFSQIN